MNGFEWTMAAAFLIAAAWIDVRKLLIPNALNFCFAIAGIAYQTSANGMDGCAAACVGALSGLASTGVLYAAKGLGGGDVKWFGAFGTWAGALVTIQLVFWSILFAGVIAALLLFLRLPGLRAVASRLPWPWGPHPAKAYRSSRFPFMLAVVPALATLAFGSF